MARPRRQVAGFENSAAVRCLARGCAVAGRLAEPGGIFRLTCLAKSLPFQPWLSTSLEPEGFRLQARIIAGPSPLSGSPRTELCGTKLAQTISPHSVGAR